MIKKLLVLYLVFMFSFIWGLSVVQFEIFPYKIISPFAKDFINFLYDENKGKKTSLLDKIKNDANIFPSRLLGEYTLTGLENFKTLNFNKFKKRRTGKLLFKKNYENKSQDGFLLFHGFFDFKKNMHGAFLIDMDGNIIKYWEYDDEHFFKSATTEKQKKSVIEATNTDVHGLLIFKDGSIVFTGNDEHGSGLSKMSFCGKYIWSKFGKFHHLLSKNHDNNIWTMHHDGMYLLDSKNGKILKQITLGEIKAKNRDLGIFNIHQDLPGRKIPFGDQWHNNDIEPINKNIGNFKKGDLLVSYRNSNLIFIMNEQLKVKWWRIGATRRQHDPDWSNDSYITVYDNSMRDNTLAEDKKEFTRILKINLEDYKYDVLYDGQNHSAYSVIKGSHQILPNKDILMTFPKQGRVLIVNQNSEKKLEILNKFSIQYNGNINNAIWLRSDFFDFDPSKKKCSNLIEEPQ